MDCLDSILVCFPSNHQVALPPTPTNEKTIIYHQPVPYKDDAVEQFIEVLRTADCAGKELEERLKSIIHTNGWTERLAEAILNGIEKLVKESGKMAAAMAEATEKATNTALEFAKEHPYYTALIIAGTIITIGALVMLAPWVLEALGFAARGPRLGL